MEVKGEDATFFDGDVHVIIYFDDVSTNVTRVWAEAQPGYAATIWLRDKARTREFTTPIPVGVNEWPIPNGVARRLSFGNDVPDGDPSPVEPGTIEVTYDVVKVV